MIVKREYEVIKFDDKTNICFNENNISKKILKHNKHLAPYLIASNNNFLNIGLKRVIKEGFILNIPTLVTHTVNNDIKPVILELTFDDIKLEPPFYMNQKNKISMLPSHAIKMRKIM